MSQAKHWMFTINNPTVEADHLILNLPCKYCIYSYEQAASGTVHIQGYVSFSVAKKLPYLTKALPGAHFELRRGTHSQAKAYCSKVDDDTFLDGPYVIGDDSDIVDKSGSRTDLSAVKRDMDAGATMTDIWDNHFEASTRYHRAFETYMDLKTKHRVFAKGEKPKVRILVGPTGSGKSSRCREEYPGAYWLTKPSTAQSTLWWQNYSGEEVVVFDEFYGWIAYDLLLRILDYYPVIVEKKGGSAKLAAKTFIFTSNKHPDEWYSKVKDTSALKRRISEFGTIEFIEPPPSELEKENFNLEVEQGYISEEL